MTDSVESHLVAVTHAQAELRAWPGHRRAALLEGVAAALSSARDRFAQLIVREARKPIRYARAEVDRAISTFIFAAAEARCLGGELIPIDAAPGGEGRIGMALRVPRGPVLAITPFNFPLNLVAHKVAPALACGAPVLLKPAPETPETALALTQIVHELGAPHGALSCVPCSVDEAGRLVDDERLRVLSFTGSAQVGWRLKARAGSKHVLLELGGNAAAIVMPDADFESALPGLVTSAFAYGGQVCIKLQRLFIHDSLWNRALPALIQAIGDQAVVGAPEQEEVVVGPLIRARDAERIENWIAEARAHGAKLLLGDRREGNTIWPTLLNQVPDHCKVVAEEAFGPVLVVERFTELDAAIAAVNASPYGLQASIFTSNQSTLMHAFRSLRVGAVIHNDAPSFRVDQMPYGGTKASGTGREGPRYAIAEMTEPRLLVMRG